MSSFLMTRIASFRKEAEVEAQAKEEEVSARGDDILEVPIRTRLIVTGSYGY